MKKVFISREPELTFQLNQLIQGSGCELMAVSQITTSAITFQNPVPSTDWVFLYSPKAVRFFFNANPVFSQTPMFGAISGGTAKALAEFVEVDFIGSGTDTEETARKFASQIGKQRVLTPQSDISLDVLSRLMEEGQVVPLICYQTREKPVPVGFPDVLVFSSPANVRSFFMVNQVLSWQKIIAYGPSTATALLASGYGAEIVLTDTADERVARAIFDVISG